MQNFFQPENYHHANLGFYQKSYYLDICEFLKRVDSESSQLQKLLIPFFDNLAPGFSPLWDKERFYILRDIAKIEPKKRFEILTFAEELSLGRLNFEIVDALCLIHISSNRDRNFSSPNSCADEEHVIRNESLARKIYEALKLIATVDERIILARYFLVRDETQKALLAAAVKESMLATNTFTIPKTLGDDLLFHGNVIDYAGIPSLFNS